MSDNHPMLEWVDEKLHHFFGGLHKRFDAYEKRVQSDTVFFDANGGTDGSGNIDIPIGTPVPVGKMLILERVVIWADGKTPASVNAAGWWSLHHGPGASPATIMDYAPRLNAANTQTLPFILEYNHNNAPRVRGGQRIYFHGVGIITSTNLAIMIQACIENEV